MTLAIERRCFNDQPCAEVLNRTRAADQAAGMGYLKEAAQLREQALKHRWICAESQRLRDGGR